MKKEGFLCIPLPNYLLKEEGDFQGDHQESLETLNFIDKETKKLWNEIKG